MYLRNLQFLRFQKIYTYCGLRQKSDCKAEPTNDGHLGYTGMLSPVESIAKNASKKLVKISVKKCTLNTNLSIHKIS